MDARTAAYKILLKIEAQQAYSNITIDNELSDLNLDSREKSLTVFLVYGVLERKLTLDYAISKLLKNGLKGIKPKVKIILRLGAFQILYAEKIPHSAAVNESVKLAKREAPYASGMVNAVLRNLVRNGFDMPSEENKSEYFSVKYSCPQWIVDMWLEYLGEDETKSVLENSLLPPPTYLRVNTLKITVDKLFDIFISKGYNAEINPNVENCITLYSAPDITHTDEYNKGLFHIQDIASQICVNKLNAKCGDTVFDMCCAPGGKSFTISQYMNNEGCIKAFDLYTARLELVNNGAKRLGIDIIETGVADASKYCKVFGLADKVLCDAPCSGLGIIRRKPEIKYKKKEDIDGIENIQLSIINNASKYVKKGGTLVYSTCTLNPKENEEVCNKFLSENKDFILKCSERLTPKKINSDGFFIAVFTKGEA